MQKVQSWQGHSSNVPREQKLQLLIIRVVIDTANVVNISSAV